MKTVDINKLFEMSQDKAERLEEELHGFSKMLFLNFELKSFFVDPLRNKDAKKKVILEILPDASELFKDFLYLLIDEELCRNIFKISNQFTGLLAEKKGIRINEVIFKDQPDPKLLLKLKTIAGEGAKFRVEINENILGGFIIKTLDGSVIDASLLRNLNDLKEEIMA